MLIAEVGNNHFGDYESALEHIRVAKECGATAVKFQAWENSELVWGSMPLEFYEQCKFDSMQIQSLIDYGQGLGILVFFSIFGENLRPTINQVMHKF